MERDSKARAAAREASMEREIKGRAAAREASVEREGKGPPGTAAPKHGQSPADRPSGIKALLPTTSPAAAHDPSLSKTRALSASGLLKERNTLDDLLGHRAYWTTS